MSAYPSTASATAGGDSTSRTVARSVVASVPSEPTRNRARSAPFSGSRCSREYPETCRANRPNSVRTIASRASTRSASAAPTGPAAAQPGPLRPARGEPDPVAGQHVQLDCGLRASAIGQRPRAARVVAQGAADGRPGVRGGVRAEPQPVRRGGRGHRVEDRTGLDDRRPGLGVDRLDVVQVAGQVQDQPGPDRVPGGGRASTAAGQRDVVPARDLGRRDHLVHVTGEGDHLRHHAVVRGVRGVLRAAAGTRVDLGQARSGQRRHELLRVLVVGPGHPGDSVLAGSVASGWVTRPALLHVAEWPNSCHHFSNPM